MRRLSVSDRFRRLKSSAHELNLRKLRLDRRQTGINRKVRFIT